MKKGGRSQSKPNAWDPIEDLIASDDRPKWFHVFRERIEELPWVTALPTSITYEGGPGFRGLPEVDLSLTCIIDPGEEEKVLKKVKDIIDLFGLNTLHFQHTIVKGDLLIKARLEADKVAMLEKRVLLKRKKYAIHKARRPRKKKPDVCDGCFIQWTCQPPDGKMLPDCKKNGKHPITEDEAKRMVEKDGGGD